MKICRDCKEEKLENEFIKNHQFKDGIDTLCKECNRKRVRQWRVLGKRDSAAETRRYKERYPGKRKEYYKEYSKKNQDKLNAKVSKYRGSKLQRTPKWDIELTEFINEEAHHLRGLRDVCTNIKWHVDHIIPLQGKNVSGLHVWNNLRVITAKENWSKNNRFFTGY